MQIPEKLTVIIGKSPEEGESLEVRRQELPVLASEAAKEGKYVWVPACFSCKGVVIEASFSTLLGNLDYFVRPIPELYERLLSDTMTKEEFEELYSAYQKSIVDVNLVEGVEGKGYVIAILIEGSEKALELLRRIAEALTEGKAKFYEPSRPVIPFQLQD